MQKASESRRPVLFHDVQSGLQVVLMSSIQTRHERLHTDGNWYPYVRYPRLHNARIIPFPVERIQSHA